jgi:putative membrane protein
MHWGHAGIGHVFWPLPMIFWLLIMGLLVWGLVRLFRSRNRWMATCYPDGQPFYPDRPPLQPSALEILRQRYARGEIDAATFDQMRERLESSGRPRE